MYVDPLSNMVCSYEDYFSEIWNVHNLSNNKRCDIFIYHAYTLFVSHSAVAGYQKPRTVFLEGREDDEDHPRQLRLFCYSKALRFVHKYHNKVRSAFHIEMEQHQLEKFIMTSIHGTHILLCHVDDQVNAYTMGSILFGLRAVELLLSFLLCRHVDDDLHKPKVKMRRNSRAKLLLTLNVVGISECFDQERQESRMTPFEEGEDDEDIPGSPHLSSSPHDKSELSNEASTKKAYLGPMTRSRAKQIQQEVNVLLADHNTDMHENFILPKSRVLILLRYNVEDNEQLSAHEETSSATHKKV